MRLSRNVLNGTLFGVLFGALFPLVATLLTANNIPITNLSSLIDLHRQTPLLLIIDTAPFFLGVLAAFGAYQLDRRFQELIIENHTLNFKSLNQLIETANAPIIGIDNDDRITLWNEAIVQLSGYPKEEVMGVALTSLIDSGSVCVHQQTLQEGQSSTYEMVMLDKEGEQHQLLLSSSPQYNQRGEIVGCVSIGQDITELNAARQKEQIANELTVLIDTANAPIFGIDTAGLVNEWNQMAERITGYSKSEVMGQNLVESFITENYKVSVKGVLDEALTGRETANYAFPLYSKTNARVDVLLNSTTRRNIRGEIVGCVSIGQDITELNAARQKEQIANELTVLIDTANAPIFGIDIEGLVNEWNQTAERITGYSKSEVMGRNLVENFITADYKASVKGVLDEALKGRETANYEFPLYSKTNARVDVLLNSTTRRDAQGRVSGVVGVGQDVTELNRSRKEFEKQLASAANYDVLTGLPNRRYFQDYLA
ncbi:MAG: PAS domain S-box protein, partial [Methylococcales bacterium]